MAVIGDIQVKSSAGLTDIEKYDLLIKTLLTSTETTLPGSRGFGLNAEYISLEPQVAMNMFAVDLYEKVEEFIPEINIKDITWTAEDTGKVSPTIYIEGREESD